jgi:ribokinase
MLDRSFPGAGYRRGMRVAVVGHVEWIEFGRVDRVPPAGGIAHATEAWEEPGGGGAVAAMRLAALAGGCEFFTAVGDDERGERMVRGLRTMGVEVHAAVRSAPTRRAVTLIDQNGERTITTLGERLEPAASDPIPWGHLEGTDAVYVTAGDPGAFAAARRSRTLVVTTRVLAQLIAADVVPDALVGSARDPAEAVRIEALPWSVPLLVRTEGTDGGSFRTSDGNEGRFSAVPPPGPIVDTYGAGDSFAAGLTYALGAGRSVADAVAFAAACGAGAVVVRGAGTGGS